MEPTTLKALEESIAHWRRLATDTAAATEGTTGASCALCHSFAGEEKDCDGCPVKERSGSSQCEGTPWHSAYLAFAAYGPHSQKFLSAAEAQLAFLESLLPKTTDK